MQDNRVRHLTLISDDGIMLFHTAFIPKEIDEVLLSGFTGAITAIANELGDDIKQIEMRNQIFYLNRFEDYIMILSVSSELEEEYVKNRMDQLEESDHLLTMCNEESLDVLIHANNELHLEITELFDIDTFQDDIDYEISDIDDEDEIFNEVLRELDDMANMEF